MLATMSGLQNLTSLISGAFLPPGGMSGVRDRNSCDNNAVPMAAYLEDVAVGLGY